MNEQRNDKPMPRSNQPETETPDIPVQEEKHTSAVTESVQQFDKRSHQQVSLIFLHDHYRSGGGTSDFTPQNKTTKYEHIIPQLVAAEQNSKIEGILIILNTVGGDVEAGLAIAEMIALKQTDSDCCYWRRT